jgi:membrane-bound ClpP family serine protease
MVQDKMTVKKWWEIRAKGKKRYVITNGILPAIGINFFIVGVASFIEYGPLFFYKEAFILKFLILSMVMAIIGYFIGLHYWKRYEEMCEAIKGYEGRRKKS